MKIVSILLIFLFTGTLLVGQSPGKDTPMYYKKDLITWGKYTYTDNLSGLNELMTDLQKVDEELYRRLLPEYEEMVERNRLGRRVGAIGGSVGLGFMFHGVFSGLVGREDGEKWRLNYATLTIGGLITTGSLIYASNKLVRRFDIIHFANRFNEMAKGSKLRFSLTPQLHYEQQNQNAFGGGLSFQMSF